MDIKAEAEKLITKFKTDKEFQENFLKDPTKAVEEALGVDLPEEQINGIIEQIKANAGGILGKLGGLFSK